jgi:hypothetical protein
MHLMGLIMPLTRRYYRNAAYPAICDILVKDISAHLDPAMWSTESKPLHKHELVASAAYSITQIAIRSRACIPGELSL